MSTRIRITGLLLLMMAIFSDGLAQKAIITTNNGLIIGFGAGAAYQNADVANSSGGGFDFILGSQIYKKEGGFLSVDWRFRFLAGENQAYDYRVNTDGTFSNNNYRFFNYDLELGLTLNRLRERTGIVLTGFGGLGITHGRTFADLYNPLGVAYDYSVIDLNQDRQSIYNELVSLTDGVFETRVSNQGALLPTAGFFIGYQFTKSFSLGLEYKTNFYLSEQNNFTGINLDNKIAIGSAMDRNSYTGLKFSWNLRGGNGGTVSEYDPGTYIPPVNPSNNVTTVTTNTVPVSVPLPTITILDPATDPYFTDSDVYQIRAAIGNVSGAYYISFYQNGLANYGFNYDATTRIFTAQVRLEAGENVFRITAMNQSGNAESGVTITSGGPRVAVQPLPVAEFTYPGEPDVTTEQEAVDIEARTVNVYSKQDIRLLQNGQSIPFDYNPSTGAIRTDVLLDQGENIFELTAYNEAGSDQDRLRVFYDVPVRVEPPAIRFINPGHPVMVSEARFNVLAETWNVFYRAGISMSVNGRPVNSFAFRDNGDVELSLNLTEGVNTIEIRVENEAGYDVERTSITYSRPEVRLYPPEIIINEPSSSPYRTYESVTGFRAAVYNVESRERINLKINGRETNDFTFNINNGELRSKVTLSEGQNVLTLSAWNRSGNETKTQVIVKESRPCPAPVIRLLEPERVQSSITRKDISIRAEVLNIENNRQLHLTVNGNSVPFGFYNNILTATLPLNQGMNTISLTARNNCGDDSFNARVTYSPEQKPEPCTTPKVTFGVNPVNATDATHELKGVISGIDSRSGITIQVDSRPFEDFQFYHATGEVKARLQLNPGNHNIVVSVRNSCGTDNRGVSVVAERPCNPPTVSLTISQVDGGSSTHMYKGSASGLKDRSGLHILLDGRPVNDYQFNTQTGELNGRLQLSPGSHSLVVNARNDCGSDSKTVSVAVQQPCTSPTVNVSVSPVDGGDATHSLRAKATRVENKADISISIDGRAFDAFQFNSGTGDISASLKLSQGSHSIDVTVRNSCGSDHKTVSVSVQQACVPPKVAVTISEVNRQDATHELRGTISNIKNKTGIAVLVDGRPDQGFQFVPSTGELSTKFKLGAGNHTIVVTANNECGADNKSMSVTVQQPCVPPRVAVTVSEVNRQDATHELRGTISNIKNKTGIAVLVDGRPDQGFQFVPSTGELSTKFRLGAGSHTIVVTANNECGSDNKSMSVTVQQPCIPPKVTFTVGKVSGSEEVYELKGTISNVKDRSGISLMLDGRAVTNYQFVSPTGAISAQATLGAGSHTIQLTASNECGKDVASQTVQVAQQACGPRINPGNAPWQFCLVTPSRTYTAEDLRNPNFTYTGPASSLFFMPIAGGGPATVNGQPYNLRSGQYYLFSSSLYVTVSKKNPGSVGQWSVCIRATKAPVSGNGNNRPKSPCEGE